MSRSVFVEVFVAAALIVDPCAAAQLKHPAKDSVDHLCSTRSLFVLSTACDEVFVRVVVAAVVCVELRLVFAAVVVAAFVLPER